MEDDYMYPNGNYSRRTKLRFIKSKVDLNNNEPIREAIDKKFSDPGKYFDIDDKVIIGKVIRPIKMDDEYKSYKMVGSSMSLGSTRSTARMRSNHSGTTLNSLSQFQTKVNKKTDSKVAITDKGLNDLYDGIKKRKKRNAYRINEFLENVDGRAKKEMSEIMSSQEKVLAMKGINDDKHDRFTDFLKFRLKKSDNDMLMNNIHNYRVKKEINEYVEKNQPIEYKYGKSYWLMTLRRPDDFEGVRYSYINIRDSFNPFWQLVKETIPNESEFIRSPYKSARELDMVAKNEYFKKSLGRMDIKVDNSMHFKSLNNLSVRVYFMILDRG
jgi:hypothetical protein